MARERGRVAERQALAPQAADRVILAGDRVERRECGTGEKGQFFGVFRHVARPRRIAGPEDINWVRRERDAGAIAPRSFS